MDDRNAGVSREGGIRGPVPRECCPDVKMDVSCTRYVEDGRRASKNGKSQSAHEPGRLSAPKGRSLSGQRRAASGAASKLLSLPSPCRCSPPHKW